MGNVEQEVRAQIRRTKINSAIIGVIAMAGFLSVAAIAPGVLGALGKTGFLTQRNNRIKSSLSRLIQAGYLRIEKNGGTARVCLTKRGEWFAARIGEGTLIPKKPKQWDGKWRMLIFDIPERRKKSREQVRLVLIGLGFHRLQDSVWVYPYDCEDFITVLKTDMRLGRDVLYVIADKIEQDKKLKEQFGLS